MRKSNKKGFTIVELVIVIAVIAILSAVLIPTFGSIVDKANESAALQEASNAYKNALVEVLADDGVIDEATYTDGTYTFTFTDGVLTGVTISDSSYTYTVEEGVIKSATKASN